MGEGLTMHVEIIDAVERVIGYRARCSCGWLGKVWESVQEANAEFLAHYAKETGDQTVHVKE